MKKLVSYMILATMVFALAGCGGSKAPAEKTTAKEATAKEATTTKPADETAATEADITGDYTEAQVKTAGDFADMTDRYNQLADQVNADENLNTIQELVDTMNTLADAISEDDAMFKDPALLTDEVLKNLDEGIVLGNQLLDELEAMISNYAGKKTITIPVEIVNNTGADLYSLAMSPANDDNWGGNLLVDPLKDGESGTTNMTFTEDTLVWDLLAADAEETSLTFMGLDCSAAPTTGAKLVLSNEDGTYMAGFEE